MLVVLIALGVWGEQTALLLLKWKNFCMEECHNWLVPCVLILWFGNAKVRLSKVVTMCWWVVTGNMHFIDAQGYSWEPSNWKYAFYWLTGIFTRTCLRGQFSTSPFWRTMQGSHRSCCFILILRFLCLESTFSNIHSVWSIFGIECGAQVFILCAWVL